LRVVADSSRDDEALVRSFGPDLVLRRGDRYPDDVRRAVGAGANGFFDTAAIGSAALPAIRDGGKLAVVRGWSEDEPERGIEVKRLGVSAQLQRTEWLDELRALASQGVLQLRVATTYPLDQAARAHRAMAAGGLRGRGVIVF
jgi:NADPH:quinone reductase-like Zn-dependent oxidoreductase